MSARRPDEITALLHEWSRGDERALPRRSSPDKVRAYSLTLKRLGAAEMVTGADEASERHYRAALAMEEDAIRRHPDDRRARAFERSWAALMLAIELQDLADAGGPGARSRTDDARALVRTLQPDDVTAAGSVTPDPEFRQEYDRLAARLHDSIAPPKQR